jgi:hypothetical protein
VDWQRPDKAGECEQHAACPCWMVDHSRTPE